MQEFRFFFLFFLALLSTNLKGQYILKMNYSQMEPYIGKRFEIRVTETNGGKEVGRKTIPVIQAAAFSFDLYVLLQGRSYNVDFYADVNGNGRYDAPPADHAWRRVVNNANQATTINFTPDNMYMDIQFPADVFPYSQYDADWGGKWMNLTFGSTDTIQADFQILCDSIHIHFTTAGIFGNPAQVEFDLREKIPDENSNDTVRFHPSAPWTGEAYVIHEELHGDLSLSPFELIFTGTIGVKQILALYNVNLSGSPLANGYFYVRELEINSSAPPLKVNIYAEPPYISCNGEWITLCADDQGGVGVAVYSWSDGEIGSCLLVPAGTWSVTIFDGNGCTASDTMEVIEPPPLIAEPIKTDASCWGACDGAISLLVFGGTPPYLYSDQTGLCTGAYEIFAMDANGCTVSNDVIIMSPDQLIIYGIQTTDETDNQANGTLNIEVIGGTMPYTYSIDNITFQDGSTFTGLAAGTYTVYVLDAHGCTISATDIIINNITATLDPSSSYRVFPNPVKSILQVKCDKALSLDLITPTGLLIWHTSPSTLHQVNVSGVPAGLYLLRLTDGSRQRFSKILIQ